MKISGQTMDSHIGRKVKVYADNENLLEDTKLPCMCHVYMERAWLTYGSERDHYRPMLRLIGRVKGIEGNFPYGITDVDFGDDEQKQPQVSFLYHFDNEELADMCKKGLFDDGFEIPSIMENNDFELPIECDYRMVVPENENDVPILFVQIDNQFGMDTSSQLSGYRLADYFQDAVEPEYEGEDLEFDDMDMPEDKILFAQNEPEASVEEEVEADKEMTSEEELLMKVHEEIEERVDERLSENAPSEEVSEEDDVETDLEEPTESPSEGRNEMSPELADLAKDENLEEAEEDEFVDSL